MCGVAGCWEQRVVSQTHLRSSIVKMTESLFHRGPDGFGALEWPDHGLALGHRRLAIQDLSSAGKQPMASHSNRYVITYNGEVYNAPALRKALENERKVVEWHGHSDTEIILACIEAWGLQKAVQRFVGMFAFALWDEEEHRLHLVRDRLGIKPLYYGWQQGTFLFGSELKALRAHPAFRGEINRDALTLFFRHNVIPSPYSIYHGIHKLTPGSILTLTEPSADPTIKTYWDAWTVAAVSQQNLFPGSYEEAVLELEGLLSDAVKIRLLSDVPLGAFLSGGVDSSTIVALMQAQSSKPIKSFSIAFTEEEYNEAPHAAAVAEHLNTDHIELIASPRQALDVITQLPTIYDEPFSDSSQIPTFLVSQLTRQHVTVALSGDGGDELFCGYNRYLWAAPIWETLGKSPKSFCSISRHILRSMSVENWNRCYKIVEPMIPERWRMQSPGRNAHRLAYILSCSNERDLYLSLVSHWDQSDQLVLQGNEPPTRLTQSNQPKCASFIEWMMAQDLVTYLPDDILTKVDRASMAIALEARVPLLDHRLVEFAWSLPLEWKLNQHTGKRILRDVLYRHVPKKLIDRPKMGFAVPVERWLRHELRDWAEDLLDDTKLRRQGFLNPAPIRKKWNEHLSGKTNWQYHLWDVLMWQAWLQKEQEEN